MSATKIKQLSLKKLGCFYRNSVSCVARTEWIVENQLTGTFQLPPSFEPITMNVKSNSGKPFKLDAKKIAMIVLVLGIAGYQWYTQNYPSKKSTAGGETAQVDTQDRPASGHDYQVNFPADKKQDSKKDTRSNSVQGKSNGSSSAQVKTENQPAGPYLKPDGGRNLKSPAGLIYTGGREHRSDHVLRHAKDMPDRPGTHGVFTANGDDVFRLVDEAYELVKSKSKQVKMTPANDGKTEYVIDMKRKIGYKGGQSGKRSNHPPLYKVKLILGDNRVITAYPY